jgi:hypothetical protein
MAGRPTDYDKDIAPSVKEYIDARKTEGHVPTIEGLAVFLDVPRSTIYKWAEEHPEFSDILEKLLSNQGELLIDNGLIGKFNAPITKMMLTKHGYADAHDVTSGGEKIAVAGFNFTRNENNNAGDLANR